MPQLNARMLIKLLSHKGRRLFDGGYYTRGRLFSGMDLRNDKHALGVYKLADDELF